MADKESILQLGIEAARAGDKEEARKFFRLLTRETPQDSQAWLWLAGVAEDRDEKRAALEMVTQLDPSNQMAQKSLASLGGPRPVAPVVPPTPEPVQDYSTSLDDFDVDWDQTQTTASTASTNVRSFDPDETKLDFGTTKASTLDDDFSFLNTERERPTAPIAEPARTRDLTPDEEWARSLDSFGAASSAVNERAKTGAKGDELINFDIPDFGDDFDVNEYMNRERVDASTIEVTAEEAKAPVRKPITKGGISDDAKARLKEKKPRPVGAQRASGGLMPLLLAALALLLIFGGLWWWLNRGDRGGVAGGNGTSTTGVQGNGGGTTSTLPLITGGGTGTQGGNGTQGGTYPPPGGGTNPGGGTAPGGTGGENQPPANPPTNNVPVDPNLGGVQPNILPNGVTPVNVDNWFFNYSGISSIADGNVMNFQPNGRWVAVRLLMFDGTNEGRTIPADLIVLKDDQGRVYRANPDASEAYVNVNPGSFNINQKQAAPTGFNFSVPLLFDVAPDATNLVLFSPLDTNNGYFVRDSAY